MSILSDAEYRQLSEAEKTRYWRTRYEEEEDKCRRLRIENDNLVLVFKLVREALDRLT